MENYRIGVHFGVHNSFRGTSLLLANTLLFINAIQGAERAGMHCRAGGTGNGGNGKSGTGNSRNGKSWTGNAVKIFLFFAM